MRRLLIDGNNLLIRAVYGAGHGGMTTSDGEWNTGPLVAFINTLSRLVHDYRPGAMAVCWDAGPSEYRLGLYPDYKSARNDPPLPGDELTKESHFALAKTFLTHAGIQQVAVPGWEADDVIAAYWQQQADVTVDPGLLVIASGDKDFAQLLDLGVIQVRPMNGGRYELWTLDVVLEKYGCLPHQMPLLKALMGDPTDGIPGVRGLGPKKALKALEKASWRLEEVQELSDPVKRSAADLSLALVDLREAPRPEVPPLSIFQPYGPKDGSMFQNLVLYLRALEIESVVDKLYAGTLWEPRRPA